MYLFRYLAVVLIVLSASLSGAMAAGHAFSASLGPEAVNTDAMAIAHQNCCENSAEHSSTCHVLPALVSVLQADINIPMQMYSVIFGAPILLTGIKPTCSLDPPRAI